MLAFLVRDPAGGIGSTWCSGAKLSSDSVLCCGSLPPDPLSSRPATTPARGWIDSVATWMSGGFQALTGAGSRS